MHQYKSNFKGNCSSSDIVELNRKAALKRILLSNPNKAAKITKLQKVNLNNTLKGFGKVRLNKIDSQRKSEYSLYCLHMMK